MKFPQQLPQQLRRTLIALLCIWLGLMIYIVLSNLSGVLTIHEYTPQIRMAIFGSSLYILSGWIIFVPLVFWLADKVPVHPAGWPKSVSLHLLFLVLVALAHALLNAYLYYTGGNVSPDMKDYAPWQHAGHFLFLDDHFLFDAITYAFLVASRNITHFYDQAKQQELDALKLVSQLTESRLHALRMQVNPHFLFNTLNTIQVLIRKGENSTAEHMLQKLSDFFRQTLKLGEEQCVPLRREMELINHYLGIEKVRFGDRLTVHFEMEDDCRSVPVPALLLQPLVENAVRHGLNSDQGCAEIHVKASRHDNILLLVVSDNGTGLKDLENLKDEPNGFGIGLTNTRMRLQTLYGESGKLQIDNAVDQGVVVTISLPIEQDATS